MKYKMKWSVLFLFCLFSVETNALKRFRSISKTKRAALYKKRVARLQVNRSGIKKIDKTFIVGSRSEKRIISSRMKKCLSRKVNAAELEDPQKVIERVRLLKSHSVDGEEYPIMDQCRIGTAQRMIDDERSIVVIVPSYNNKEWYKRNLDSIFEQDYGNYRVIYIDDYSPDGTHDLVRDYIHEHNLYHKITLIRNEVNVGAMDNLYKAIHRCHDWDIIVTLDGDDWFPAKHVLGAINAAYADGNTLLTYGQFRMYPSSKRGWCNSIPLYVVINNTFREYNWIATHLRTFYAGLFKHIKIEDLTYEGELFRVTWDMAMMFPMLEMSAGRFKFIPEILYDYNMETPLNDFKLRAEKSKICHDYIRTMQRYSHLKEIPDSIEA